MYGSRQRQKEGDSMWSVCVCVCVEKLTHLRAVWKIRSSSQSGCSRANLSASRLCSRRKIVCSAVSPGFSLLRSSPQTNNWSLGTTLTKERITQ
jgi:hypothetical protein